MFTVLFYTGVLFSKPVKEIRIEGNKYVPDEIIIEIITTKKGSRFTLEKIRKDIRRLYRTGFFKTVEVYKFEDEEGISLLFKVEDRPVIYKIEFEGNEEIDDEDLENKLGIETEVGKIDVDELLAEYTSSPAIEERLEIQRRIKLGRVLTSQDIQFLIQRIKQIYLEEGYPDVEVTYKIVPKKGASKLVFYIKEKEKKYVVDIVFKGNKTFSSRKLKGLMQTEDRNIFIFRFKPPFSEEILKDDIERIKEFYRSEGFLEVKVNYKVERKNGRHDIYIFIEEGPRYRLKELIITGNYFYAYKELVGNYLKKNERKGGYFRREVIEKIKANILKLYGDLGFANTFVEEDVRVDTKKKEVTVILKVHEGEPVYVRKIKIEGNYETRDYVIRREMRVQEGELAIGNALRRSRTRILNLGYYQDVQIKPVPVDKKEWDLLVKIRERFTGQFSVGLSYNEVTGLSGFISVRKGNFLGTGDILGVSVSYGQNYRNNALSYTDKWFLNKPMDLTWSIFDRRVDYVTYSIVRRGVNVTLSKEFREYWKWSVGTSIQRVVYSNIDPEASTFVQEQAGSRETRKLIFGLSRDTRDYFLFPRRGSLMRISHSIAIPLFGGTEQFNKTVFSIAKFIEDTYFDSGLVFSSKLTLGIVEGYGNKDVPIDERFFVGGDYTIRGYNYGMAGPVDPNTLDPIGAKKQIILNFELNYKLHEMLYVGVFYDTGRGGDTLKELDPSNWLGGYGIGIRLVTPMLPIRIDWAWKTKTVPGDTSPSRIHFILGSFF